MKGKLKTLDEIEAISLCEHNNGLYDFVIYNSNNRNFLPIHFRDEFGKIINIKIFDTYIGRIVYHGEFRGHSQLYYDEWFEWIGKPPKPPLEDEFNNLINAIEGW